MIRTRILSADTILSGIPFDNECFKNIWTEVKKSIKYVDYPEVQNRMNDAIYSYAAERSIQHRLAISLVAVANYVFSFSLLCSLLHKLDETKDIRPEEIIKKKDIRLLLGGGRLADNVFESLIGIISNPAMMSAVRENITLEAFLCPDDHKENYDSHRNFISGNSKSIDNALDGVFSLHRKPEKFGLIVVPNKSTESAGVGESFLSMVSLLSNFKRSGIDIDTEVNAYIDKKIDEGLISSFYAETKSPAGKSYLKRYFRAGANSII